MLTKSELIDRITTMANDNSLVLPPGTSAFSAETNMPLDSIALLELIVALEEEFQISLMDEELGAADRLRDMDALASLILEKLNAELN